MEEERVGRRLVFRVKSFECREQLVLTRISRTGRICSLAVHFLVCSLPGELLLPAPLRATQGFLLTVLAIVTPGGPNRSPSHRWSF
ncbi:unnamed protein product [Merluccius merluccius]